MRLFYFDLKFKLSLDVTKITVVAESEDQAREEVYSHMVDKSKIKSLRIINAVSIDCAPIIVELNSSMQHEFKYLNRKPLDTVHAS